MDELVDYCINLGQSYAHGQIELGEAREYIASAINEYSLALMEEYRAAIASRKDTP